MTVDLTGRVALVTGANRGIGFEVCRALGQHGAEVALGSRDSEKGKIAASTLQAEGLNVVSHQLDVTQQDSVQRLTAWLEANQGRLDVLVNNAGIMPNMKSAIEATLEEVEGMWQVNTVGVWRTSLALLALMRRNRWGRIVNVSSEAGSLQSMNESAAAYRVSKAALNAFTRVLAAQVSPDGILVNSVCPGWVHSDMGGPAAPRTPAQGAASVMWAVTLDDDGPSGGFYRDGKPLPW
jgi:NAD(P)-dependent dehydrogenase (short-subunit alcohol dehydrogenase family)